MNAKHNLTVVPDEPEPPIDIYADMRERRNKIDWKALHERKREPIDLPDRVRRGWRF